MVYLPHALQESHLTGALNRAFRNASPPIPPQTEEHGGDAHLENDNSQLHNMRVCL